jgi:ergothioneine biosynthesis protein EgtB
LHAFADNPLSSVYREGTLEASPSQAPLTWRPYGGGLVEIGTTGNGFWFDNEEPRHQVFLRPYALASRPISVGEVKSFIADGGYQTPSLWLSEGYAAVQSHQWIAPQYVELRDGAYRAFSLRGWVLPSDDEPACHLSFWEAEAIARFLGARLQTEAEWEHAAGCVDAADGNFVDGPLRPRAGSSQMFGNVWQWTRSSYQPYPGFRPSAGAVGEYNGKFMAQQYVLRGGSCLTPRGHVRASYRNFWHPDTRFQMSGARLARDI